MTKPLADGSTAVGLFNLGEVPQELAVRWQDLGLARPRLLRDVWRQLDLPVPGRALSASVPRHGVFLVRCFP
jgi:alpha-galactosidase